MTDPVALASLALSMYETWSRRQRERIQSGLLSRVVHLEKQVDNLDKHQLEELDSLIGRAISAGMKDSRSWKLSSLANLLDNDYTDDSCMEEISSCMDILDRMDFRHVRILSSIRNLSCDDSTKTDATRSDVDRSLLNTRTYESIEIYCLESYDMNKTLIWSSISDLSNWGVIQTHPSSSKSKGRMMININPHGLLQCQSFSFSLIGKMLLGVLELHSEQDSKGTNC